MTQQNSETEIKLAVENLEDMLARLSAKGFQIVKERHFEANEVYDTAAAELRHRGSLLRLREAAGDCVLTFKGPAVSGKYKSREEIEVNLSDASNGAQILARLGFEKRFRYEKYRTEFARSGGGLVLVDETPVGLYLELEGSPEWIDEVAVELGFVHSDYITKSYGALYMEYCKANSFEPADMVFEK
jgi:adenylate cyclase class 2